MFKAAIKYSLLFLVCAAANANTVLLTGGESWASIPGNLATSLGSGSPYWDDNSIDGSQYNVGYFLMGTGAFAGGTNYAPTGYVSQSGGYSGSDSPASLSMLQTSSTLTVTLLASVTANTLETVGFYDASQTTVAGATASEVPLVGAPGPYGSSIGIPTTYSVPMGEDVGFYLTQCITYSGPSTCSQYTTWFSNTALDSSSQQHFALFSSASGTLYLGVEDWSIPVTGFEQWGDFNDFIFAVTSVPEPATFGMLAGGLALLAACGMRLKKRSA